jgi:hypothetical protein
MKHSPKPNTNSVPAQDVTNVETHENVLVNKPIPRTSPASLGETLPVIIRERRVWAGLSLNCGGK